MTDPKNRKFNVGDRVRWHSQALGHSKEKEGIIVAVVPKGCLVEATAASLTPTSASLKRLGATCTGVRDHDSYIVRVRARTYYWPLVQKLTCSEKAPAGAKTFTVRWDKIPAYYQYVAMDSNRYWYAYSCRPVIRESCDLFWSAGTSSDSPAPGLVPVGRPMRHLHSVRLYPPGLLSGKLPSSSRWRETLVERPVPKVGAPAPTASAPLAPSPSKDQDPNGVDQHAPGAKLDAGKADASLLLDFGLALHAVAQIGTFGAKKYTRGGWKTVPDGETRYTAAMIRHLLQEHVEKVDKDSGLLHAAHAAWNALARLQLMLATSADGK